MEGSQHQRDQKYLFKGLELEKVDTNACESSHARVNLADATEKSDDPPPLRRNIDLTASARSLP